MTDIKPLSHGYYHDCFHAKTYDYMGNCVLCATRLKNDCRVGCRLCQFEDPTILLPLLTGQRKLLRNVLKDLWDHIDHVLEATENSAETKIIARELCYLLSNCKVTGWYLDSENGKGWSEHLFQVAKALASMCCRKHKCFCAKSFEAVYVCSYCKKCEKNRKRKRY